MMRARFVVYSTFSVKTQVLIQQPSTKYTIPRQTNPLRLHSSTIIDIEPPQQSPLVTHMKELRKSVNQFLRLVHPDFLRGYPQVSKINEKSLSSLNSLLDIVEQYTVNDSKTFRLQRTKTPERYKMVFYIKTKPKAKLEDFDCVSFEYKFPERFFSKDSTPYELQLESTVFFNQIFERVGMEQIELPLDMPDREKLYKEHEKKQNLWKKRKFGSEGEFKMALKENLSPEYNLMSWKFNQKFEKEESSTNLSSDDSMWFEAKQKIFYQTSLTPGQRGEVWKDFLHNKENLKYNDWSDLPICFTDGSYFNPEKKPGFVCIPYGFNTGELSKYLERELPIIRKQRRKIRNMIFTLRTNQTKLKNQLHLLSINYENLTYPKAIESVNGLLNNSQILETLYLEGVNLTISSNVLNVSLNLLENSIIIPCEEKSDKIVEYLQKNIERLKKHYILNAFTRKNLVRTKLIIKELERIINAKVIIGHEIFQNSVLRFMALFNLRNHQEMLRKYNLKTMTIVLTNRWKMDWLRKRIYIPFDFSENQFHYFFKLIHKKNVKRLK